MQAPLEGDAASEAGALRETEQQRADAEAAIWITLSTLWQHRRLIAILTGVAAVLSIIISLLLSNWYMAETRLLLPGKSGSGLLFGLASGGLPASATSLLGNVSGDYQRYLAILDSRTVKESLVEAFDLEEVYELEDAEAPRFEAVEILGGNIEFVVDEEYNYLAIQVYDKDPDRAAEMANFFVDELNRVNTKLASQNAGTYRRMVEQRYVASEARLDSLNEVLRDLQAQSGVVDLTAQSKAFLEGATKWRFEVHAAEIDYERLRYLYGDRNSVVQSSQRAIDMANRRYEALLAGQERLMPISQDSLADLTHNFLALEVDRLVQVKVLEVLRPALEEALLEEEREEEAVQVVDEGVPPVEKARPWRALIVVSSTISGFLLAAMYVLASVWWRRRAGMIGNKLDTAYRDLA